MLRNEIVFPGIHKLSPLQNIEIDPAISFLELAKKLVNTPEKILKEHEKLTCVLEMQIHNENIPSIDEIRTNVTDLYGKVLELVRKHPLCLFNECVLEYCSMNRVFGARKLIELFIASTDILPRTDNFCLVGPGGFFQELVILTTRVLRNKDPMNVYVLENFVDYFEANSGDVIDPLKYTGKMDDVALQRARWMCMKTVIYRMFIEWFQRLGVRVNLFMCESADDYAKYIQRSQERFMTIGIDLLDDFAESTTYAFGVASLATRGLCLHFSEGYSWNVFINETSEICDRKSLEKEHKKIEQISTGEEEGAISFGWNIIKLTYKMSSKARRRIHWIVGLSTVFLVLPALF